MTSSAASLVPVNTTLGVLLAALLLAAAVVAGRFHLDPHPYKSRAREILVAGLRAAAQLAVVSVVIAWAVKSVPGLLAFLVGILIGGALTVTVLAGRRALDELTQRNGEVEAAMALGFLDRDARMEIARPAASEALLPGLDQTRTVGLVTLPGAFVGMLMAGASPVMAGAVQLFVLIALMAVQSVAVAVTLELVARHHLHRPAPGAPSGSPRKARRPMKRP